MARPPASSTQTHALVRSDVQVRAGGLADAGRLVARLVGPRRRASALVSDDTVARLYGDRVRGSLLEAGADPVTHLIRPGEGSKSFGELDRLCSRLAEAGVARDGLLIALGGGVVTDLTGLAAAVWMRGIDWIACPTTLEADIDAAIGGKTAVNLPAGKNLVGAFHPPRMVLIDPTCLRTLDPRDVRAGLAESVKHAVIASEEFLSWHEANTNEILALDETVCTELIRRNVEIKTGIVDRDPFERTGERAILNFGHTVGHALETCCQYRLRHGECVGLGMLAACRVARSLGLMDAAMVERVHRLLSSFGLPTKLGTDIDVNSVHSALKQDKKVREGRLHFVLLEAVGRPVIRSDVSEEAVVDAIRSLLP